MPSRAMLAAVPADAARAWREMDYPIAIARSLGAYVWDLDGNRYIDLSLGAGAHLLGHAPEAVTNAVKRCVGGAETRPLAALVDDATQLLRSLTGMDYVIWMRSASHALQAAVQVARRRTRRSLIARFANGGVDEAGDDEVAGRSANDMVLTFGSDEALAAIRRHAAEIAAVVVDATQGSARRRARAGRSCSACAS